LTSRSSTSDRERCLDFTLLLRPALFVRSPHDLDLVPQPALKVLDLVALLVDESADGSFALVPKRMEGVGGLLC
jgi:hypothetical protein